MASFNRVTKIETLLDQSHLSQSVDCTFTSVDAAAAQVAAIWALTPIHICKPHYYLFQFVDVFYSEPGGLNLLRQFLQALANANV